MEGVEASGTEKLYAMCDIREGDELCRGLNVVGTDRKGICYCDKLMQLGQGITYCDLRKPRADRKVELRLKPLLRTRCASRRRQLATANFSDVIQRASDCQMHASIMLCLATSRLRACYLWENWRSLLETVVLVVILTSQ